MNTSMPFRVTVSLLLPILSFSVQSASRAAAPADGSLRHSDVFVSGKEGFHTFRIPALVVTPKGALLAFCEGRKTSRADLGDNDLLLKRSNDGGRTWGKLQLVYEEGGDAKITIGNPTVVVDRDTATIFVVFLRQTSDVLITRSNDEGKTWSKPQNITAQVKDPKWGFYAVGPGLGIQIQHGPDKGRLVIPAYHRMTRNKSGPSTAHVFYSDDHGKSWRLGGSVGLHTNECQLVETRQRDTKGKIASRLLINTRNHWARSGGRPDLNGRRIISTSRDGGRTWAKPTFDAALIEPTCQATLVRYSWKEPDGKSRILFANPAARSRKNLTVRLSYDEGQTWPVKKTVYAGSAAYSCLTRLPDGRIGLIYERDNYGKITFASFTLGWLTDGKDALKR